MNNVINFLLIVPIILSLIGLYFVVKIWLVWTKIDKSILKARVFLSDKFLMKNWLYVFLAGAFITTHIVVDSIEVFTGVISEPDARLITQTLDLLAVVVLVVLAAEWHKLIKTIKK